MAYCCLVIYLSSLSPKDLPDQALYIPDTVLHFIEYSIMGVLGWAAFGGGGGFPGPCSLFVVVLELGMNAGRIGWADRELRMCGMLPQML